MYIINMKKFELIRYVDGSFSLDVTVSPTEDTVWLNKDQIASLFERDRSVITRHIQAIFKEGELDAKRVCAKNAQTGPDGKTYQVDYYNLDVIISVGFRVKSRRGVLFRKWANNVLRDFMIKGYALSQNRTLVTNENYIELINKVNSMDVRIGNIEEKIVAQPNERVFFSGAFFDSYEFVSSIIKSANHDIILIDTYADEATLKILSARNKEVSIAIYLSSKARLKQEAVDAFNKEYGNLTIHYRDSFHDRFLIIDNVIGYYVGASLNSLGKKVFEISKIGDRFIVESIIQEAKKHE